MDPNSKAGRIFEAFRAGATTVADVEVDLEFAMSRHLIAGHVSNLLKAGLLERTGTYVTQADGRRGHASRSAHVYRVRESAT